MAVVLGRKPGGGGGGGAPSGPAGGSLSGTYPNPSIANDAVDTAQIADDAVEQAQIADDAVGTAQIAAGAVGRSELAAGIGAFDLIEEIIVGVGGIATVTFDAIPGTYRHLQIRALMQTENAANQEVRIRFNNDSGANYYDMLSKLVANGTYSESSADAASFSRVGAAPATGSSQPSDFTLDISWYSQTVQRKLFHSHGFWFDSSGGTNQNLDRWGGLWTNNAVITQIDLFCGASDFKEGSRFNLYGIG